MRRLLEEITRILADAPALDEVVRADAAREARLIAAAILDVAPGELARTIERPRTDLEDVESRIRLAAVRRASGEPLAYAVGSAPFRHLVLQVDNRVLIPRPETEGLVDEVLGLPLPTGGLAIDIGTGSGAIALALATEGRFDRVVATDISADALDVARMNSERVRPRTPVEFRLGADFAPLGSLRARVIVSNPPYIAYEEAAALPASVRDWEPSMALFAADRGMARYEILLTQATQYLEPGGWIAVEVDARRGSETADRARQCGWVDVRLIRDLSGRDRVMVARSSVAQDRYSFSPDPRPGYHA